MGDLDGKSNTSKVGAGQKFIVGLLAVVVGGLLVIAVVGGLLWALIAIWPTGDKTAVNTEADIGKIGETLTFSLTSKAELYNYGETAAFQVVVTNISFKTETVKVEEGCADPILFINETKLESPQCQKETAEIVLGPGESTSWQWQYNILEPDSTVTASDIALKPGTHILSSRWLGNEQENLDFSVN